MGGTGDTTLGGVFSESSIENPNNLAIITILGVCAPSIYQSLLSTKSLLESVAGTLPAESIRLADSCIDTPSA